jgi:hypothetical protein
LFLLSRCSQEIAYLLQGFNTPTGVALLWAPYLAQICVAVGFEIFSSHEPPTPRTTMVSTDSSIEALDIRLRRLEYALTGTPTNPLPKEDLKPGTIPTQITSLNDRLARLSTQNKPLKRLLQACSPRNPTLTQATPNPPS